MCDIGTLVAKSQYPIAGTVTAEPVKAADRQGKTDSASHPNRLRHPTPPVILLTLQQSQVGGGHRERRMVQEPRHVLNNRARIAPELGGGVAEDVDPGRREPRVSEVPLELRVEGAAS